MKWVTESNVIAAVGLVLAFGAILFVGMSHAEPATLVEYKGQGVLNLTQEKDGYLVTDKYAANPAKMEAVILFENGTLHNVSAGLVLRSKAFEGDSIDVKIKKNGQGELNPHTMTAKLVKSNHRSENESPDGLSLPYLPNFQRVASRIVSKI